MLLMLNTENDDKAYIVESYKSTEMAKPYIMNNKICNISDY
jgi:hypothetical protein